MHVDEPAKRAVEMQVSGMEKANHRRPALYNSWLTDEWEGCTTGVRGIYVG